MPARAPLSIDTLWSLERVGSLTLAPDASAAVCALTSCSMRENKSATGLWLLPTAACAPRRLTRCGEKDGQPAWSPRGDRIAFLARREQEGKKDAERQLYLIPAAGGEAWRASDFGPGIEDFKWMPGGRRVVFVSWVWPGLRGAKAQSKRHKEFTERKESAYVTAEAQYRHFDRNLPMGRVPRLLMLDLASGRVTDLFEGTDFELPRADPGAVHFDVSPDGKRIAFVHDPAPRKVAGNPLAIAELDLATRRITARTGDAHWSYDAPRYGPGGELACIAANVGRRHTMPGRIALWQGGTRWKILGGRWDGDVEAPLRWTADGIAILFTAEARGRKPLWRLDLASESFSVAVQGGWVQGFDLAGPPGEETVVVAIDCAAHPVQVHAMRAGRPPRRLERFNDAILSRVSLGETREVTV